MMPNSSNSANDSLQIDQTVRGEHSQVLGQMSGGTAIGNVEGQIHIYQADPETIKRIVREELRLPPQEYGDPVKVGLNALAELLQVPEVNSAVITFRVDFQAACEQINIIANYKALHDQLHTLEFQCYAGIIQEAKRFPDETALDILSDHELTLQNILAEIQDIAGRETISTKEVLWLQDLSFAQAELHGAIVDLNIRRLQKTVWSLNRVLAIQPSRINSQLNEAARTLRIKALLAAMQAIWTKLAESNVNQKKLGQFQQGVEGLAVLNERFDALIRAHDYWQEMDLELRRIEGNLEKDLIELEMSWPDLKEKTAVLFNPAGDQWAVNFQKDSQNLDAAFDAQNPAKVKQYFRRYRRKASDRFFQVDVVLKRLCEELREVGEPLVSILRMIE
jgi:hypothetical protein